MALAFGLLLAGPSAAAEAPADGLVLYRGAILIDGKGGAERPGMAILTRGERIETIARAADLPAPAAEANLRKDLYGGVTAVRDMADDLRQVADLADPTSTTPP